MTAENKKAGLAAPTMQEVDRRATDLYASGLDDPNDSLYRPLTGS